MARKPPPSLMCSVAVAAQLLGVSERTVRDQIKNGTWPADIAVRHIGERTLINRDQLEKWCRGEPTRAAS